MPVCPRCTEANPDKARFCLACGFELAAARAVRKLVTLLFADVVGSTSLAEAMDAEAFSALIGRFFREMKSVVERHGGSVERYAGDEVIAAFGVPVVHEDDALRAVRAATEMIQRLEELNHELGPGWGHHVEIRVGINSGEVAFGDAGHHGVLGDPANVAARLQKSARPGQVVLGETTYRLVRDCVTVDPLPPLGLKGKATPSRAYHLIDVAPATSIPARRLESPLVGRTRELVLLRQGFDRVVDDCGCHLITLLGDPGVGKSRLIREVTTQLEARARVLRGRCLPYGEGITFWPVVEIVRDATEITSDEQADLARRKLDAYLDDLPDAPLVADLVAQILGMSDRVATREETFWAIRRFFERAASEQPLVLVVDDIHWGEEVFLDLLDHLVQKSRRVAMLVLCTARPELLEQRPYWGGGKLNATSILLQPLKDNESVQLLTNLLGNDGIQDLLARVVETTQGNPLFIEEMVGMLIDEGQVEGDGGDRSAGLAVAVPPTLQALLNARLELLKSSERRVIAVGAVMGKVFSASPVAALSELAEAEVDDSLEALVDRDLIRPDAVALAGTTSYSFRHMLIRDAAYQQLPKGERAAMHERYADWLAEAVGDRIVEYEEIIGYHLEQAVLYSKQVGSPAGHAERLAARAVDHLLHAGNRAADRGDAGAGSGLLARATDLLSDDDPRKPELLLQHARLLHHHGGWAEADPLYTRTLELLADDPTSLLRISASAGQATLRLYLDTDTDTDALFVQAQGWLRAAEAAGATSVEGEVWGLLALLARVPGRTSEGEAALERAIACAARAGDIWSETRYRRGLLRDKSMGGPTPILEALSEAEDLLRWARDREDRLTESSALRALARCYAARGDFVRSREAADAHEQLCSDFDYDLMRAWGTLDGGEAALLEKDLTRAASEFELGAAILQRHGEKGVLSTVLARLAEVQVRQGRWDEARANALTSRSLATPDDYVSNVGWRCALAGVLLHEGELHQAEALLREGLAIVDTTDDLELRAAPRAQLAEVLLLKPGHDDEPTRLLEDAVRLYGEKGNSVLERDVSAALGRARAAAPVTPVGTSGGSAPRKVG